MEDRQAKFPHWTSRKARRTFSNRVNFTAAAPDGQSGQSTSAEQTAFSAFCTFVGCGGDGGWEWQSSILSSFFPQGDRRRGAASTTRTRIHKQVSNLSMAGFDEMDEMDEIDETFTPSFFSLSIQPR